MHLHFVDNLNHVMEYIHLFGVRFLWNLKEALTYHLAVSAAGYFNCSSSYCQVKEIFVSLQVILPKYVLPALCPQFGKTNLSHTTS